MRWQLDRIDKLQNSFNSGGIYLLHHQIQKLNLIYSSFVNAVWLNWNGIKKPIQYVFRDRTCGDQAVSQTTTKFSLMRCCLFDIVVSDKVCRNK